MEWANKRKRVVRVKKEEEKNARSEKPFGFNEKRPTMQIKRIF